MQISLLPIKESLTENQEFLEVPECNESLQMTIMFFSLIGYTPPWIGYFVSIGDKIVGSAAFKGRPMNGRVEIAYGTFPSFRNQGIGAAVCKELVKIASHVDPTVTITARTERQPNYSTRILEKNGFELVGTVVDPDDGEVWEWVYRPE